MKKIINFGKNRIYDVMNEGFTLEVLRKLEPNATEKRYKELTGRDSKEFVKEMDVAIKKMREKKDVQKVQKQKKVQPKKQRNSEL
jgi:hypothetical protein